VWLPSGDDNRHWLQNGKHTKPEWIAQEAYWELPKSWLNDFVDRALKRYEAFEHGKGRGAFGRSSASRRLIRLPSERGARYFLTKY